MASRSGTVLYSNHGGDKATDAAIPSLRSASGVLQHYPVPNVPAHQWPADMFRNARIMIIFQKSRRRVRIPWFAEGPPVAGQARFKTHELHDALVTFTLIVLGGDRRRFSTAGLCINE